MAIDKIYHFVNDTKNLYHKIEDYIISEVLLEKVFWKYATDLQENSNAEVWF